MNTQQGLLRIIFVLTLLDVFLSVTACLAITGIISYIGWNIITLTPNISYHAWAYIYSQIILFPITLTYIAFANLMLIFNYALIWILKGFAER